MWCFFLNEQEVDGVIAFYSAKDIPGLNSFTPDDLPLYAKAEEVLCSGRVCYYEQPIGIIVAEDQITADTAAKLVKATYKNVKNPVVNIKEAIKDASRNTLYTSADATETGTDVTKVISGTNSGDGQYHFTMETLVCVTNPTEEGLEIHTATQWTNGVQLMVSRALGIEKNRFVIFDRLIAYIEAFMCDQMILNMTQMSLVVLHCTIGIIVIRVLITLCLSSLLFRLEMKKSGDRASLPR